MSGDCFFFVFFCHVRLITTPCQVFFFFFFFFFFCHVRLITTPCQVFNNYAMSGDFLPCKTYYRTISGLTIAPCQLIFFFFFFFSMLGLLPHHVRCLTTVSCQATFFFFFPCKLHHIRSYNCAMSGNLFFFFFFFSMLGLLPHHVRCLTTAPCQATFCHVRLITAPYQVLQLLCQAIFFFFFFPWKAYYRTISGHTIVLCQAIFFFFFFFSM